MINRHDFQQVARHFRAGRISLSEFTDRVFDPRTPMADSEASPPKDSTIAMPVRPVDAHKGDFGRVLAIGGSAMMPGSISMTALAALRSGSGLVIAIVPDDARQSVQSFSPCPMVIATLSTDGMFSKLALEIIIEHCNWADVVAIGPGMGRSKLCQEIVQHVYQHLAVPVVVDADGLNNLADAQHDLAQHEGLRILTPHPGEFRRLSHSVSTDCQEMESEAINLAKKTQTTIVLKGHHTLITNGENIFRNPTGNSGMATAGSGDVLTGVITSLMGQGLSTIEAAKSGCYVHGLAGDLAAKRYGQISMIATDLVAALPDAFKSLCT